MALLAGSGGKGPKGVLPLGISRGEAYSFSEFLSRDCATLRPPLSRPIRWRMSPSWTRPLRFILSISALLSLGRSRRVRRLKRQHERRRLSIERRRRHQALARRLRRPEGRLRQGHPAVPEDARGQGRHVQPVLRRLRRPVAQGRVRPADRRRQLLASSPTSRASSKSGQVDDDWNQDEHKGIPFGSVVTIVDPQGQPEEHQDLGRPAQAGRRGRHPEPVQLGLREVEPARAVRREERRRREPAGRPRLPRPS